MLTTQEREELKREWDELYYEKGERSESELWYFILSHIDHILETKAQALEREQGIQYNSEFSDERHEWANRAHNEALDLAISIIRGKSETEKLLEKGAKHFAENFTDTITRLADE